MSQNTKQGRGSVRFDAIVKLPLVPIGRMRIGLHIGSSKNDPEKLITPGIVYNTEKEDGFSVHAFAFGWWHFAAILYIGMVPKRKAT